MKDDKFAFAFYTVLIVPESYLMASVNHLKLFNKIEQWLLTFTFLILSLNICYPFSGVSQTKVHSGPDSKDRGDHVGGGECCPWRFYPGCSLCKRTCLLSAPAGGAGAPPRGLRAPPSLPERGQAP